MANNSLSENEVSKRCEKCWCPEEMGHNTGCPDHPDAKPTDQAEYDRGWSVGFSDNRRFG